MKQRLLTAQQRKLLEMQQTGALDKSIADAMGVNIGTVRLKRAALRRGFAKGLYSDVGLLPASGAVVHDLFAEGVA